jgi:hypothetical protein
MLIDTPLFSGCAPRAGDSNGPTALGMHNNEKPSGLKKAEGQEAALSDLVVDPPQAL